MGIQNKAQPNGPKVTQLALLGPPPVLRTEHAEHYEAMFDQLLDCFEPEDFFELMLLRKIADAGWHIKRYTRHQTIAVERWYRQSLEFQAQRLRSENAKREALVKTQAEGLAQSPQDIAALTQLEEKALSVADDIMEILSRTPNELEHNRALEKSMETQEKLQRLIISETARFHKALETFEHYRMVFAPDLRKKAMHIVEHADYAINDDSLPQVATCSIVPGKKDAQ
jgi:hypothetical protein